MQAVILAGGLGTRLSEETELRPKPMVEIGGKPILWHIMKAYLAAGVDEFIVCCGYKGYVIKEYFANYFLHNSDFTYDFRENDLRVHHRNVEPWTVTLIDTGAETMTGGRIRRIRDYVGDTFCMTYGDGVSNVDIAGSIEFHREHGRRATVTAARPPGRFGALDLDGDRVHGFHEKPEGDGDWINAGFFVLEPDVFDHIDGDATIWEREPMERLASSDQLRAWYHNDFWMPMDTLRDKQRLEELWASGAAPWKTW